MSDECENLGLEAFTDLESVETSAGCRFGSLCLSVHVLPVMHRYGVCCSAAGRST